MAFKNRIRLPITLGKAQFPIERNIFRKANGERKVLSVVISKTVEGVTDQLPEEWHQKLVVALSHDEVTIEDTRLLTGVALDGDYGIEWQDFLNYPLAQARFTAQITPFSATNSNCQTCEELAQVVANNDTVEETWEEGNTYNGASVLLNDAVCCYPSTVSLRSFNTFFFSSVSINPDGTFSATLNNPVPNASNVLVATYRVTCPDGSYDEANIYVQTVTGSGAVCEAPTDGVLVNASASTLSVSWSGTVGEYGWEIATQADPNTVLQSGVVYAEGIVITGLDPDTAYVVRVWSICNVYSISDEISINATTDVPTAHLDPDNYSYQPTSGITGVCDLFTTSAVRTADAAADSVLAGARCKITIVYSNDAMDPTVEVEYTFEIGATVANENTSVSFPSYCGEINGVVTDVAVIP
jgi:hypothetical protein